MTHSSHQAGAALLLLPVVLLGCQKAAPSELGEPVLVRVQREGKPEQELRVALSKPHETPPLVPEVVRAFTQAQTQCATEGQRTSIDATYSWGGTSWELVPGEAPPGCMELSFVAVVPKILKPPPVGIRLRVLGGVAQGPLEPAPASPTPGSPTPGSPAPGSPAPGSPAP
jgi:hypothetical protein